MSDFRSYSTDALPPVVKYLIIVNVVVFIAQMLLDPIMGLTMRFLALPPIDAPGFSPYQVITHMFTHGSFFHLLFNMIGLWVFGRELERYWGGKRFLNFYMICGLGAALIHLLVQYLMGGYSYAVGASGAVMGIFTAFAYLFPNTPLMLMFIPVPIKAKYLMLLLIAYDVFGGIGGGDNIAHFAHLGGVATGFIMVWIWNRNRARFY
jgi:membrane associated rhomboid family serine protease